MEFLRSIYRSMFDAREAASTVRQLNSMLVSRFGGEHPCGTRVCLDGSSGNGSLRRRPALVMNWILQTLLLLALVALPAISRVHGQDALEIRADQDSSTTSDRPEPPAESDTAEEAQPKKKS